MEPAGDRAHQEGTWAIRKSVQEFLRSAGPRAACRSSPTTLNTAHCPPSKSLAPGMQVSARGSRVYRRPHGDTATAQGPAAGHQALCPPRPRSQPANLLYTHSGSLCVQLLLSAFTGADLLCRLLQAGTGTTPSPHGGGSASLCWGHCPATCPSSEVTITAAQ